MMLSDTFKRFIKFAWFLPGFLLWAVFPPMGERMDVVFALAPLMWLSRRTDDARHSAKLWFANGLFFWVATLSWMPAIVKNGGPWPLVVLGWGALAAYCALFFGLYGYLSARYWQWARNERGGAYGWRILGCLVVEPIWWCGLELVRSRLFGGFAWNQLGVAAVNAGLGAPAALGGVYLCSACIVLVNGTIAGIAERMWHPERSGFPALKRWGALETLAVFVVVAAVYAAAQPPLTSTSHLHLKVAMIQRNFPCCFQRQDENPLKIYERLLAPVAELGCELVVLPESAMCEFGPVDRQGAVRFAEWVSQQTGGAALLAGGTRFGDGREYNSAALYSPQSAQPLIYDKVHLVPFGEFIPGDKLFPALQKFAPVGSCTPGKLKLLPLSTSTSFLRLGCAICFEDTDSAQMRKLAKMGAQVLFFITNDSWFSDSVEAEQHAWQAVARAVETGLPVVRVGNSGVTGTIAPDGKASWLIGTKGKPLVDKEGTMFDKVEVRGGGAGGERTAYVLWGDWPLGIAFALLILALILVKYHSTYEKRRSMSM